MASTSLSRNKRLLIIKEAYTLIWTESGHVYRAKIRPNSTYVSARIVVPAGTHRQVVKRLMWKRFGIDIDRLPKYTSLIHSRAHDDEYFTDTKYPTHRSSFHTPTYAELMIMNLDPTPPEHYHGA